MANKIRAGFIDNSDNEDGFKINVGTGIGAEVTHDLPRNRNLIDGGTLLTNPSATPTDTGDVYEVDIEDAQEGSNEVNVIAYNKGGDSDALNLGMVNVYARSDLIIYIGSDDLLGSGVSSSLEQLEGKSVERLSELIKGTKISNNYKFTSFVKADWRDAEPTYSDTVSAEVGLFDEISTGKHRTTSIWKLSLPNALASSSFGPSGEGRTLIEQYLRDDLEALMLQYHQPRIKAVILNMRLNDASIASAYQSLIDYLRTYLELPELPIILTDSAPSGVIASDIQFKLESRNSLVGEYYKLRGMEGYYSYPIADSITSPDFWMMSNQNGKQDKFYAYTWKKLYNLDFSEHTDGHYITYNKGSTLSSHSWKYFNTGVFMHEHGDVNQNWDYIASELGVTLATLKEALQELGSDGEKYMSRSGNQFGDIHTGRYYVPLLYPTWGGLYEQYTHQVARAFSNDEVVEVRIFADRDITFKKVTNSFDGHIYITPNRYLPFPTAYQMPGIDNDDPKKEIHSIYARLPNQFLPYSSYARSDASRRGISQINALPSVFTSLARNNKNVTYVKRDDLELINNNLTINSQIELGRRYARTIKNLGKITDVGIYDFRFWLDASRGEYFVNYGVDKSLKAGINYDWNISNVVYPNQVTGLQNIQYSSTGYSVVDPNDPWSMTPFALEYGNPINGLNTWWFRDTCVIPFSRTNQLVFRSPNVKYVFLLIVPQNFVRSYAFSQTNGNLGARWLAHLAWEDGRPYLYSRDGTRIYDQDPVTCGRPLVVSCVFDTEADLFLLRMNGKQIQGNAVGQSPNTPPLCIGAHINGESQAFFDAFLLQDSEEVRNKTNNVDIIPWTGSFGKSYPMDAQLGEFIAHDESIGLSGVKDVENYLANKWGVVINEE